MKKIDLAKVPAARDNHKIRKKPDLAIVVVPEKKPEEKPKENIFEITSETMLLTDTGRITKAGFILEFYRLRNGYCLKLYDEIKALLETKAYMISEKVHYDFLLKSFDRVCLSVWMRKDKLTIEQMKTTICKTMADIQSNIISNIILILPE